MTSGGILMPNGKNTAFFIIALVIGAAGIGMGAYSIIRYEVIEGPQGLQGDPGLDGIDGIDGDDGTDGDDGVDGTIDNLVAVWENVTGSGTSFKLTLGDIQVNNSEFFHMTDSNTTVHLDQEGWYRFTLRFAWNSLELSLHAYYLQVYKNLSPTMDLVRVENPYTAFYCYYGTVLVHSNGMSDFYHFLCSTTSDSFSVYTEQSWNQVVLEYVGTE